MDKLVQTPESSVIYGDFRGNPDQELFRCPRALDDTDIPRFVNSTRSLIGFADDDTKDTRKVPGKTMIGYFRMYFRDGNWYGRWFIESKTEPDKLDCLGVQKIVDHFTETFKKGCDASMKTYFEQNYTMRAENRYFVKPLYSDIYKVMIDTTYGNEDYPVRIYVYRDIDECFEKPISLEQIIWG